MRNTVYIYVLLFSAILFLDCKHPNKNCSFQVVDLNNNVYKIEGCLVDSLEDGSWYFYDTASKVSEFGNFNKGIRAGEWHYPNKVDSIIFWKDFTNANLNLRTNIPSLMHIIDENLVYVKLSNLDTTNLFNIAIAVYDMSKDSIDVSKHYEQGQKEVLQKGWTYKPPNRKILVSDKRKFYLNEYDIDTLNGKGFLILNVYSLLSNNKLVEISCRYNEKSSGTARIIFFSIISNCFIKNIRFLDPFSSAEVESN